VTAVEVRDLAVRAGRGARRTVRAFYARPLGWAALLVTSAFLAYGGGGVMFWFHAIYRGEQGPAIGDVQHWLFDASLGFLALTPALFFILPAALWALDRARVGSRRLKAVTYPLVVGVLFGVVTGPGPLLHDWLVGKGTFLADLAERVFGHDPSVAARTAEAATHSGASSVLLQIVVGIPVYVAFGLLALWTVRALARRTAR
jgi:hypothetical protein